MYMTTPWHWWLAAACVLACAAAWGGAAAREGDVPPAYVISVPNTRPRDAVAARFRGRVPSLQFVDGVDGTTVEPGSMGRLKPGEIGCALSHARVWRRILESGGPALVFEDDAQPVDDFPTRVADVLRHIDDTIDVVFLGHCLEERGQPYAPGLRNSVLPRCTHGYLVTPRGARTLVSWMARASLTRAIDEELATLIQQGGLRALSCDPPLVTTTDGDDSLIMRMGGRWHS